MKNLVILFSFYILTFFVEHTLSKKEKKQKISDINVLLPICESLNCNRVYYSIHARGGCYEW